MSDGHVAAFLQASRASLFAWVWGVVALSQLQSRFGDQLRQHIARRDELGTDSKKAAAVMLAAFREVWVDQGLVTPLANL